MLLKILYRDCHGNTPLHYAVEAQQLKMTEALLS